MHELNDNNAWGGLNSDDELRNVPKGDFIHSKNIRVAINQTNKGGAMLNIKGNTLITKHCLPYNNDVFPEGNNKVIGSVEDTKYNTVIYFVWNSQSKHQILRYYRDLTSPANPYGEIHQVIQYDFGWTRRTKIDSANIVYGVTETGDEDELTGDLLYWSDKTPRKINLTKGEVCGKEKCWDVFLPVTTDEIPATTLFTFKDFSGATVFTKNVNTSGQIAATSVTANFVDLFPFDQITFIGVNLTGATSITISGASDPANNRTFSIRSVDYASFGNISTIVVNQTVGVEFSQVNITWEVNGDRRYTIIKSIALAFNSDTSSPIAAEACDCKLELCEKVSGAVWTVELDTNTMLVPASNWYGATLISRFFDRCKWQPLNAPRGTFEKDVNYEPNYVQRYTFQSRLEYGYDDLERSALGVWSQIPINNLGCDGTSDKSYNYIDWNFEDDLIANAETLVILKRIRFIARQGNPAYGEVEGVRTQTGGFDRAVITLEPCDFLDYVDGAWFCHYNFYNDIISSPIDAATAAKLFDNVPLESNDERFMKNRLVEGGILEGYDAPECVKAKVQMEFGDNPNPRGYKITGKLKINNFFLNEAHTAIPRSQLPFDVCIRSPILFNDPLNNDYPYYGGAIYDGANLEIRDESVSLFGQLLPTGGFPAYLVGTDFLDISKQAQVVATGISQLSNGAIDVTGGKNGLVDFYKTGATDVYSTFEFDNVPNGTYVIRIASPQCSFGDVLGKGFMYNLDAGKAYQTTSAPVWGCNIYDASAGTYTWKITSEITVTVNNGDVFVGDFIIADYTYPQPGFDFSQSKVFQGYLIDNNGQQDQSNLVFGLSVEKTEIAVYSSITGLFPTGYANVNDYFGGLSNSGLTDHNGFFFTPGLRQGLEPHTAFFAAWQIKNSTPTNYTVIRPPASTTYRATMTSVVAESSALIELQNQTLTQTTIFEEQFNELILPVSNNQARDLVSTIIKGRIIDPNTNIPIGGVLVIYEEGKSVLTDANGVFQIVAWGDMSYAFYNSPFGYQFNKRIIDRIIISSSAFCLFEFPDGSIFEVLLNPFEGYYSPTIPYDLGDIRAVEVLNFINDKARKRGGNYPLVARGYDDPGRLCSCFKLFDAYIPFITEDIGKYEIEDFSAVVYPTGTFKYGKPTLKVVLDPATVFPLWMTSLQILFPINTIYGRYLQWRANEVVYLSSIATIDNPEIPTAFINGNATAIKISLKNILSYSSYNPNSQIGYQFEIGDRLRLIADRDIRYYNGLFDFEIVSYDATAQSIIVKYEGFSSEIKSGAFLEIFNPKSVATDDQQIFYECGEVIKVVNGIPQEYERTFTAGDTFWRRRQIVVNDTATNFTASYPVTVEDASVSDFYPSLAQDIGRIGIIDPAFKQVYAPTKVRCSNVFLPSTAINGLSSFEELNQKEFDRSNGQIERLLVLNNTIIAVTSQREISNYIEVVSFQQADVGSGILAIANQYFGTEYPHSKRLGTDHPSSVLIHDGQGLGFQGKRGDVWKYLGDGEATISNNKMRQYFNRLQQSGTSDAIAVYHRLFDEYYLTVWRKYKASVFVSYVKRSVTGYDITVVTEVTPEVGSPVEIQILIDGVYVTYTGEVKTTMTGGLVIDITTSAILTLPTGSFIDITYSIPETVVFFNGNIEGAKNRWLRFDSRTPEGWQQLGSGIVSFMEGKVWIEDTNETYNSFYGQTYPTQITTVFNDNPTKVKIWNSIWLEQRQTDKNCGWYSNNITNENEQQSRLKSANWVKRENVFYTPFLRDTTDQTVQSPIVSGRMLRSCALVVELTNDYVGQITLYGFKANWTYSERTTH